MENTLVHHVRSRNKKKLVATVVATKIIDCIDPMKDSVVVSWSKCNYKAGDKYSKEDGKKYAVNRAHFGTNKSVPPAICKYVNEMVDRAKRYFKGVDVKVVTTRIR